MIQAHWSPWRMTGNSVEKNFLRFNKAFTLIEVVFVTLIIVVLVSIASSILNNYKTLAYDTVTKNELREAYRAASVYFSQHPTGKISMPLLETYGFTSSSRTELRIFNASLKGLLIAGAYKVPGAQAYAVDATGKVIPVAKRITEVTGMGRLGQPLNPGGQGDSSSSPSEEGAAIPTVKTELQSAYGAALSYFINHPDGVVSKSILETNGYNPDPTVNLAIADGTLNGLRLTASSSKPGSDSLSIDSTGNIF
jgi:prepilin-type N-terminal cleavage/methylation domain-containing protein